GMVGLVLVGVWVAYDPDRRSIERLSVIGGAILGGLALVIQVGPSSWFGWTAHERGRRAELRETLNGRNAVNRQISELWERGPHAPGTPPHREFAQLEEARVQYESMLSQLELLEVAPPH